MDLSKIIPKSLRPVAKAVIAAAVPFVGLLVVLGVISVEVGDSLVKQLVLAATISGLTGGAVYETRNHRRDETHDLRE